MDGSMGSSSGSSCSKQLGTSIASLWQQQLLCDVALAASDGEQLLAHRLILSASSGFFRALFCGAGQQMREGGSGTSSSMACPVVALPYPAQQLSLLLSILYDQGTQVTAANVTWLLEMASYLEVPPLQEACCSFLRSALSPETCVDVLLLAHHFHCHSLQQEGVLYLAQRLSSLLLSSHSRGLLSRLPHCLLQQLLSCEALEVEQEAELLCFLADWVLCDGSPSSSSMSSSSSNLAQETSAAPATAGCVDRLALLPQLLSLLQLSALAEQPALTRQQLAACSSAAAAALAEQLHWAAVQCPRLLTAVQQPASSHGKAADSSAAATDVAFLLQLQDQQAAVPSSSSSTPWWQASATDGGGTTDVPYWPAGCDPNNNTSSSPSSSEFVSSSSAGSSGGGDCIITRPDVGRIGAVMLQAWPGTQRGYQPTKLLVAGGHDLSWRGLKAVELYDPLTESWAPGPALPAALPFAGSGLLGRGELFVVGGGMYSTLLARLDSSGGSWQMCEGPRMPRLHAAVTGAAGLLYVVGGRSQVNQVLSAAEVYDPSCSAWRTLPDMKQPRYAHAVAALAGRVYAVGGQATKAIHRSVELFDAERGWELLPAQLTCERKYCSVAALGGRLLALGGMTEARSRLSSMEGFDPREGKWSSLTPMQHARSSCGVAALGGRLFAVGGNAGDQLLHAAVEEYDPAAARWRSCPPLTCGRSGLLAAAV